MSDPDPEVVEAHSSAAVQLAFTTLDDVDLTRIFSMRASVMKTVPGFPQRPIPICIEDGDDGSGAPNSVASGEGLEVALATPQVAPPPPATRWAGPKEEWGLLLEASRMMKTRQWPGRGSDRDTVWIRRFNAGVTEPKNWLNWASCLQDAKHLRVQVWPQAAKLLSLS